VREQCLPHELRGWIATPSLLSSASKKQNKGSSNEAMPARADALSGTSLQLPEYLFLWSAPVLSRSRAALVAARFPARRTCPAPINFPTSPRRHLGTATDAPYRVTWHNRWVPELAEAVRTAARITSVPRVTYMTPAVEVKLVRPKRSVKMYKASGIPEKFGVRLGARHLQRQDRR
jgi:hypothetical protein